MRQFIPQDKPCAVGASEPTARSGFSCLDFHKKTPKRTVGDDIDVLIGLDDI